MRRTCSAGAMRPTALLPLRMSGALPPAPAQLGTASHRAWRLLHNLVPGSRASALRLPLLCKQRRLTALQNIVHVATATARRSTQTYGLCQQYEKSLASIRRAC